MDTIILATLFSMLVLELLIVKVEETTSARLTRFNMALIAGTITAIVLVAFSPKTILAPDSPVPIMSIQDEQLLEIEQQGLILELPNEIDTVDGKVSFTIKDGEKVIPIKLNKKDAVQYKATDGNFVYTHLTNKDGLSIHEIGVPKELIGEYEATSEWKQGLL